MAKRMMTMVVTMFIAGALMGVYHLANTDNASAWYVRVDDAVAQERSDGDEGVWEYTLEAYDEHGSHRQLTFTASKRLKAAAYLKLGYMPVRGVISWEEIPSDQVPEMALDRLP